ncbi:protein of unknown function (plasmid) [Cupriavidus neocaledonicus]|uniref:Uncharacterized protein n=1 Tax=Cupriavidus neocaledonicus TaxID=1040979 RepID=A0A375HLL2_9BURK|nr:protein of unknown function [Cupriavidus neocaledonicus]
MEDVHTALRSRPRAGKLREIP